MLACRMMSLKASCLGDCDHLRALSIYLITWTVLKMAVHGFVPLNNDRVGMDEVGEQLYALVVTIGNCGNQTVP